MKIKPPEQLFDELGIVLKNGCGEFKSRQVRYLDHCGLFQVGSDDFDRWANSVDFEFEVWQKKGQRAFFKWANLYMENEMEQRYYIDMTRKEAKEGCITIPVLQQLVEVTATEINNDGHFCKAVYNEWQDVPTVYKGEDE